jgi:hypothetical protein
VIPWLELGGVRVGTVLWGGLALLDLGRLTAAPSYAELGALAVLVTLSSVGTRTSTGVCAAVVGWLLVDGFVEHAYGVLGLDVLRDAAVLSLYVGLTVAVTATTRGAR